MHYRRRAFGLRAVPELPRESFEAVDFAASRRRPQSGALADARCRCGRGCFAGSDGARLDLFPEFQEASTRAPGCCRSSATRPTVALKLDRGAQFVPLAGSSEIDDDRGVDLPSGEDDPETSLIKIRVTSAGCRS